MVTLRRRVKIGRINKLYIIICMYVYIRAFPQVAITAQSKQESQT